MIRNHVVALLLVTLLASGACSRRKMDNSNAPAAGEEASASATADEAAGVAVAGEDRPLGEFDAVTPEEIDLYLRVMQTASARVRALSPEDRQALNQIQRMSSGGPTPAVPSPEQMAMIQRAGELLAIDGTVAQEMGVSKRFSSIQSRVDHFLMPPVGASGDDEPMTAEERARLRERIAKFRERDRQDAAVLEPHRAEIVAVRKQVNSVVRPGSPLQ